MFRIEKLPPGFEHIRMTDVLRKGFLPNGRLPTKQEIVRTFENPLEADPRLVAYFYFFGPGYGNIMNSLQEMAERDMEGEEWKYS